MKCFSNSGKFLHINEKRQDLFGDPAHASVICILSTVFFFEISSSILQDPLIRTREGALWRVRGQVQKAQDLLSILQSFRRGWFHNPQQYID